MLGVLSKSHADDTEVDGTKSAARDLARSNPLCIPLCVLSKQTWVQQKCNTGQTVMSALFQP